MNKQSETSIKELEQSKLSQKVEEIKKEYSLLFESPRLKERIHTEKILRERPDGEFQRDYSRVMYSSSFRRLQGKMQLLGIKNDQFFRNRLTHSLEVAQIARSIATELKYENDEIFVVEAGALAHDIGNPPFGHAGEKVLNEIFDTYGGFEGNAQTLRILMDLERKKPEFSGLNLTYRTLLSVVKYFNCNCENERKPKFIYKENYDTLMNFVNTTDIYPRTLDVQIVDLADEIAYAAHDLEDGLRSKSFIIDEILHEYHLKYGNSKSYNKLCEITEDAKKHSGYKSQKTSSSDYVKMFAQEMASSIIHTLINDIDLIDKDKKFKLKTGTKRDKELGFSNYEELADGLKNITFKCINHNDEVYFYEKKGAAVLKFLVDFYQENDNLLPPEYRKDGALKMRYICDYISGMMDSYTISTYEKITGKSFNSILG